MGGQHVLNDSPLVVKLHAELTAVKPNLGDGAD